MASPQKEHGFAPIANEILESLARQPLSGQQRRVLDLIFRESYGWGRKAAKLSYGEIAQRTGIGLRKVYQAIESLTDELLLKRAVVGTTAKNGSTFKTTFIFQKDYHQWTTAKKGITAKKGSSATAKKGSSLIDVKAKDKDKDVSPPTPSSGSNGYHVFMEPIGPGTSLSQIPDLVQQFISAPQVVQLARTKRVYVVAAPVRKLLLCFKKMQGFELDDTKWDRVYFKRNVDNAEDLLDVFNGDYKVAVQCLAEIAGQFSDKSLTWALNTNVNHAAASGYTKDQRS